MFLRTQPGNVTINLDSIDYISIDKTKSEIRVTILSDNPGIPDKKIPVARYENIEDAELVYDYLMACIAASKIRKICFVHLPEDGEVDEWSRDLADLIIDSRK